MILAAQILAALAGAACVQIPGDQIRARDLAAAVPLFASLPPDQSLGYAPTAGSRRRLTHLELARFGAGFASAPEICVERATQELTAERLKLILRSALADIPGVRLEVLDFSRYPIPQGELEFPRTGLGAPQPRGVLWRGRVRYGAGRSFPIWARVKLLVETDRVVAVQSLPAGRPIEAGAVRLEHADVFLFGKRAAASTALVIGRLPRRSIRAGAPVLTEALAEPRPVEQGETVSVEVRSGATELRFEARAESSGNTGELIAVRNPANGRRFMARVAGEHKVKVDANTVHSNPVLGAARGGRSR